ncbi:nitroreductase [Chloroflexota bacterium]
MSIAQAGEEAFVDLIEAIKTRKSIRSFKEEPVSEEVLAEVLDVARWAPSAVNAQPWEFVVLTGEALEAVKRANEEQFVLGVKPHPDLGRPSLSGVYLQRREEMSKHVLKLLGVEGEDKGNRDEWTRKGLRLFDAPAAILVCCDEEVAGISSAFDTGLVTQTIVLAAMHYGLGTCIQRAAVNYPDVIRKVAGIPESKRLYIGIAIGYPDWDYPVNKMRTGREQLSALATWKSSL